MKFRSAERQPTCAPTKELLKMPMRRRAGLLTLFAAIAVVFALPAPAASAESSSWWQILTGSRPTNLWEPTDNVQEVTVQPNPGFGAAIRVEVDGATVGCLGTGAFGGFCAALTGFPATSTAAQFEAMLESAFGSSAVEVSGGPVGSAPFVVTTPNQAAPTIIVSPASNALPVGTAGAKTLSAGGSGRLIVTITNLGNKVVDATTEPVTVIDELPDGVEATDVRAYATSRSEMVDCELESPSEVECHFEGELPPHEAIEIEVSANLIGEPPSAGAPGQVTVSGGKTPSESESQPIVVSPHPASFGFERFSVEAETEGGAGATRAGSHPFQLTTTMQLNSGRVIPSSELVPGTERPADLLEQPAMPRKFRFTLPAGLAGNASKMPECEMADFLATFEGNPNINLCTPDSVVGIASVTVNENHPGPILGILRLPVPIFNLPPRAGEPARFGMFVIGNPVIIDTAVDPDNQYRITASVENTTQLVSLLSATVSFWGVPGDPEHDQSRGWECTVTFAEVGPCERPSGITDDALLRLPVSCATPVDFEAEAEPWNAPPGAFIARAKSSISQQDSCNQVPFTPSIAGSPTTRLASNPSGFEFELTMPNKGWKGPKSIAEGQAKKIEVTLPEGMTINPSQGAGLVGCAPVDYARETADSQSGAGCPNASKIGEVQVSTPILKEEGRGAVYVATPYDNPFGSLLALYVVAKFPERGVIVKQAGKVTPNPVTGQLVTTFDNLPQQPFDRFLLRFREGGRAALVTPSACGTYDIVARFTPWSAQDPNNPTPKEVVTKTSQFTVERGVEGGACPAGGIPPFRPGLLAGTINNAAKSYSPFNVRLTRNDGEQEFTNFSIKLPPGVIGKLAGIPFCSDAAIAVAKDRTGPTGGAEELASPSCPAASQVGRTLVGAGVGSSLTYVPGKVYMAGPYNGSPLSVVAITAAKVGPFDLGTVVVRQALRINPETAEVFVDATGSDPIPHIIQGIPVHARDIRVYVDRPEFVLNPTSCERTSTASTVLGSGLNFGSAADNVPVTVTSPFQAADCASLGFKPRLKLSLRGKTRRGGNPALRAVMRPRVGDANAARISVALPQSEFLDQSHIRTVCTRVQFKAGAGNGTECPRGAIYGRARAWTPLLDEPLEGPVFLRSSENPLPDMVLALHGLVDFHAVGRIDSVNGGIRTTFDFVPDAPITKVVLRMGGGKKSLLENSTNICRGKHLATVKMKGHNGAVRNFGAPLKAKCGKAKKQAKRQAKS